MKPFDDAEAELASLADYVNTWCREFGLDAYQAKTWSSNEIKLAIRAIAMLASSGRTDTYILRSLKKEIK